MPVVDLFSKRQKRARGEMPDVFQYDVISDILRVQVVHMLRDALGEPWGDFPPNATSTTFGRIHDELCREYGLFSLMGDTDLSSQIAVERFIQKSQIMEHVLDAIERSFVYANLAGRSKKFIAAVHPKLRPDAAIAELNARFLEHGVGYQFEAGRIIRIDSTLVHQEVVRPALQLLAAKDFAGANDEYRSAHKHYREGDYSACLVECLKSFESTMKVICEKRGWLYGQDDRAKRLLDICFDNDLLPKYLQSHFSSLRCSLESGVPTVRNTLAGHGKGTKQVTVPQYVAAYLLHLTATSILFLVHAEEALP